MSLSTILPFTATTAIAGYRILKHGGADGAAVQATAATEDFVGVSDAMGAVVGGVCDVHLAGLAEVEYGGAVTRGARLTSDALGRAVTAAPAAGQTVEIIGRALKSGVLGDIGSVNLARSTYTRPA
ncbi:MAG: DUF2190 family protein [Brevundimonas sp.]|uniref:hypothetical protein n=1 Tax=Brevundimonas sp. TaxID=1871086 RepID=UPI001A2908AE|nr:hypothetical protein [Brevundimonas sp.]MBJ7318243.1 DUF2190 family protein [Brevundimonas sp.]